jgi:hypothetical protein
MLSAPGNVRKTAQYRSYPPLFKEKGYTSVNPCKSSVFPVNAQQDRTRKYTRKYTRIGFKFLPDYI